MGDVSVLLFICPMASASYLFHSIPYATCLTTVSSGKK